MQTSENNFYDKCYKVISLIPLGKVATYSAIAEALNSKAYRAVGNAMAKNPHLISVPCHRVIKSNGLIGGYALGSSKKINLLRKEGLFIKHGKVVDFKKNIHIF